MVSDIIDAIGWIVAAIPAFMARYYFDFAFAGLFVLLVGHYAFMKGAAKKEAEIAN